MTIWQNTLLCFHVVDGHGRIMGRGESLWRHDTIPFLVQGGFNPHSLAASLTKVHTGKFTNHLQYALKIDAAGATMSGLFFVTCAVA